MPLSVVVVAMTTAHQAGVTMRLTGAPCLARGQTKHIMTCRFRQRPRTILVTLLGFSVGFVMFLNIMVCQLNFADDFVVSSDRFQANQKQILQLSEHADQAIVHADSYVAQGRRAPKAANERFGYSDGDTYHVPPPELDETKTQGGNNYLSYNIAPSLEEKSPPPHRQISPKFGKMYPHSPINRTTKNDLNNTIDKHPNTHSTKDNVDNEQYPLEDKEEINEDYSEDIEDVVIEEEDYDDYDEDDYGQDSKNDGDNYKQEMEETYKHLPSNPVFLPEDFGNISNIQFSKPKLRYEEVVQTKPQVKHRSVKSSKHVNTSVKSSKHINVSDTNGTVTKDRTFTKIVEHGILWSAEVQRLVPKGLSNRKVLGHIAKIRTQHVQYLEPPSWNKCGRPKNGLAVMEDGSYLCARYRDPHNQLILGEVLSFYLSRMLGLDNVPAVALSLVNQSAPQWRGLDQQVLSLGWESGQVVALIQWIPDLHSRESRVNIPQLVYQAYQNQQPINADTLRKRALTPSQLSELVQWGSMFVFDYLTAHYDRVASMQDAAEKEKKPGILLESIRNLRKSSQTGKLWMIDNESGLLDAYDLVYQGGKTGGKFVKFHQQMLQTMCVFESSVVEVVHRLSQSEAPHRDLEKYAEAREPLVSKIVKDGTYPLFQTEFVHRLQEVNRWIKSCQSNSMYTKGRR